MPCGARSAAVVLAETVALQVTELAAIADDALINAQALILAYDAAKVRPAGNTVFGNMCSIS